MHASNEIWRKVKYFKDKDLIAQQHKEEATARLCKETVNIVTTNDRGTRIH